MFVQGRRLKSNLMFAGQIKSLPLNGAPECCFTWVGSILTLKHQTWLKRAVRDKHFRILQTVN
jgi:hypothetical protein